VSRPAGAPASPRLAGPRVALVPVPRAVAVAVSEHDGAAAERALVAAGLRAGDGWPHADTPDALAGAAADPDPQAGTWLVVVDGRIVGDCGWRGRPDEDGVVELGYGLAPPSRGRGLGTEAVAVLAAWTEVQPDVRLVAAQVLVGNEPSLRLLARLGFTEHGSAPPYLRLVRAPAGRALPRHRGRHVC